MSLFLNQVWLSTGTRDLDEALGEDGSDAEPFGPDDDDDDDVADFGDDKNTDLDSSFCERSVYIVDDSSAQRNVENSTKRREKRRIAFSGHRLASSAKSATSVNNAGVENGEKISVCDRPWKFNLELLCVGCGKELQPDALQGDHV